MTYREKKQLQERIAWNLYEAQRDGHVEFSNASGQQGPEFYRRWARHLLEPTRNTLP